MNLHHKDWGIALATGQAYAVLLPITAPVHQMMNAMLAAGQGNPDQSPVVLIEGLAKVEAIKNLTCF
jgi:3-hydroxyisobutyrate dehydrogenase-like beta-hydroxyacid dehydrogenase